jgi:hypothetical protein
MLRGQVVDTTRYPYSAIGELTGELSGTSRCAPYGCRLGAAQAFFGGRGGVS